MPKLLFLITEDWYFWSHRLPLARTAKARGYDVHIAARVGTLGQKIAAEGFTVHQINFKRKSKNPFVAFKIIIEIILLYWREKPDIVHHVALKPILFGTIAALVTRRRFVINALAGLGFIFITKSRWGAILRKLILLSYRVLFSPKVCTVIFQNPEDQAFFIKNRIISREKSFLIRGAGVDVERFCPFQADQDRHLPLKIVLVSRMLWDKGIGELVEAAKILKNRQIKADFLLAGVPDPENPASIATDMLRAWQNQKIVTWLGYVVDVASLLRQCHIAVLPSYREGLPKSLLEAASVELPLVATDVPGCREIVRHGKNGFLVKVKDSLSLANALEKLLQDEELRRRFGREGRNMVVHEFSERLIVGQTLSLYQELSA